MALNAGDIVFDIKGNDQGFTETMSGIAKSIGRMGQYIGAAMSAAGAAIVGFASLSVKNYTAVGDELAKMSIRTGFSVEALSELRHAASLSGTSLDAIEKASRTLSKSIYEAGQGTATYIDALKALGIRYKDIKDLSPEEQFFKVAFAIADLSDQTKKVALASELFGGRVGTQLLPMLAGGSAGLQAMRKEAHELGLTFTQESATASELFNDNLERLGKTLTGVQNYVAKALLPTLNEWTNFLVERGKDVIAWIDNHESMVATITQVAVAVGAAMLVIGPMLIALPGLAVAASGVAAVFSPMGLAILGVTAALAAGAYFVYQYASAWDGWGKLWDTLIGIFDSVVGWFETNWTQLKEIFTLGAEAVWSVIKAMGSVLKAVFTVIGAMFSSYVDGVSENFTKLVGEGKAGSGSFLDIVEFLAKTAADYFEQMAEAAGSMADFFARNWKTLKFIMDIGVKVILDPLFGMVKAVMWVVDQVTWAAGKISAAFSTIFGAQSGGGGISVSGGAPVPSGIGAQYATAGIGGGGGGGPVGGAFQITNNFYGVTNPADMSRAVAETLHLELRSRGLF